MKLALRASRFLADHHVSFETMVHPPAYSAQRLAKHLHVPGHLVAKTVLLAGPAGFYLAVLPATHQIDFAAVAREVGGPVRLGKDDEIADLFNDCERGCLCPFGHLYGLSTLLDTAIDPSATIVFEVQRHSVAIRMRLRDYEHLEKPRRLPLSRCLVRPE